MVLHPVWNWDYRNQLWNWDYGSQIQPNWIFHPCKGDIIYYGAGGLLNWAKLSASFHWSLQWRWCANGWSPPFSRVENCWSPPPSHKKCRFAVEVPLITDHVTVTACTGERNTNSGCFILFRCSHEKQSTLTYDPPSDQFYDPSIMMICWSPP